MDINEYQREAVKTKHDDVHQDSLMLGVRLATRDVINAEHSEPTKEQTILMMHKLGDLLWYVANIAELSGYTMSELAAANLIRARLHKDKMKMNLEGDIT